MQKRGLEKSVPALGVRVSKLEMEVKSLTARLAELEQRREALEGQAGVSEADAAALEELAAAVSKLGKKYNKVKVVTDKLEGEVEALQKRIMDVGGKRLQSQKAKVRAARVTHASLVAWPVELLVLTAPVWHTTHTHNTQADAAHEALEAATRAVTKARVDVKSGAKAKAKAEKAVRPQRRRGRLFRPSTLPDARTACPRSS